MSKHQGQSPEIIERNRGKHKKQKGKYELWMRYNPNSEFAWMKGLGFSEWHKHRSYKTLELAEQNKEASIRKWNCFGPGDDHWQFEIRIKND